MTSTAGLPLMEYWEKWKEKGREDGGKVVLLLPTS